MRLLVGCPDCHRRYDATGRRAGTKFRCLSGSRDAGRKRAAARRLREQPFRVDDAMPSAGDPATRGCEGGLEWLALATKIAQIVFPRKWP